jgi:hypothetical protein
MPNIFLAKNVATLRIEYVRLKDIACILKCYSQLAVHVEMWLVVASRAHVFVIKVTVWTAVRASYVLEKSGVPFVTGGGEFLSGEIYCLVQFVEIREVTKGKFGNQMTALSGRRWLGRVGLRKLNYWKS